MNISGSGTISAGEYNESISVSGSGRINGNLRCTSIRCSGSLRGEGSVECTEEAKVSGSFRLESHLTARSFAVSGSAKIGGDINADQDVAVSGSMKCGGNIKCTSLVCAGSVETDGGIEAEIAKIFGRIKCNGLLNAETVDISLEGTFSNGKIGNIGGSEIKIHLDSKRRAGAFSRLPLISKLFGAGSANELLTVEDTVEGDSVALEYTKAAKVVGRVVAIGQGCEIGLVQYSQELEIHPDAMVEKYEKI